MLKLEQTNWCTDDIHHLVPPALSRSNFYTLLSSQPVFSYSNLTQATLAQALLAFSIVSLQSVLFSQLSIFLSIFCFCPLLEKFCPLLNILHSWGPNCPDCSSFCPLSSSGQEKGCFGVGLGVFCVCTYSLKECVTAE